MQFLKKIKCVRELNEFFAGKDILIINGHEWEDSVVKFVQMVHKDGTVADQEEKPNLDLRMRVMTEFGTNLDLESKHIFIIEKRIVQRPNQN